MEEEIRQLKEQMARLTAENLTLREGQRSSSNVTNVTEQLPDAQPLEGAKAIAPERLVFVPSVRKCPCFDGESGISIDEWIEEAQACMRARYLSTKDQAFFLIDHLEGQAKEEMRFRKLAEKDEPNKIIDILRGLYGCSQSYVALQEAFFCRKQHDGETLQEFSLALMGLMNRVEQGAPSSMLNAEVLLRDQFTEHVLDNSLRRELKQLVRRNPTITLLEVREEAMRWEKEGMPGGARGRSYSVPAAYSTQYAVRGGDRPARRDSLQSPQLTELMDMLKGQQQQLNQLTQSMVSLGGMRPPSHSRRGGPWICWTCQQPGHRSWECEDQGRLPYAQLPSTARSSDRRRQAQAPAEN